MLFTHTCYLPCMLFTHATSKFGPIFQCVGGQIFDTKTSKVNMAASNN